MDVIAKIRELCDEQFDNSPMCRSDDYQLGKNLIITEILAILDDEED